VQQLPLGLAPIKRRVYELAVQGFTAFEISARLRRPVSTVRGDAEDLRKAGVNIAIPRSPTKRRTFNPQDVLSCPRLADSEIRVLKTIAVDPSLSNAAAASELGMTPSALAAAVSRACRRWRAHISGKPAEKRGSGEHPLVRQIRRARARGEYCRCGLTAPCWDHSLALRARVPAGARTARHAQMARPATAGPCPKLADLRRKPR